MRYPSYLNLSQADFEERIKKALALLNPCRICPRECKVNRLDRKAPRLGFCRLRDKAIVSSFYPHHWEERCISGSRGSGIIFFASCNLACIYCQNYQISQLRLGREVTDFELSEMMLSLQGLGCHNINLCTPQINMPQILKAVSLAIPRGLSLPLVWNTSGYDALGTLKLLDGVVDIYMPDIKYSDNKISLKYSLVEDYWDVVQVAIKEMHRQVGDLQIGEAGLAVRGLLIRHLILPGGLSGTKKVMEFIAKNISKNTYINIMDQYYPTNKAHLYPEICRRITQEGFQQAINIAKEVGLHRFDKVNYRGGER